MLSTVVFENWVEVVRLGLLRSCSAGELKPPVMPTKNEARQAVRAHLATTHTRSLVSWSGSEGAEDNTVLTEADTFTLLWSNESVVP